MATKGITPSVDAVRNPSQESEARLSQDLPPGDPQIDEHMARVPRLLENVRGPEHNGHVAGGGEPHTMYKEDEGNSPRKDGR
jgi:hypothetical protein